MRVFLYLVLILFFSACAFVDPYQYNESAIRINQIGYLTLGKKQAIVVSPTCDSFAIHNDKREAVFHGKTLAEKHWDKSGENVSIADFSSLTTPGTYYLSCGKTDSYSFQISDDPFFDLLKSATKSYYFNRASTSLESRHAGQYARPNAHPDTSVYIHASAASQNLPEGTKISTPYGWYDAGDYNKYVVNSGISTYSLLLAYQHNSPLFDTLKWNIPESDNNFPDLLDEILWNVRWMETMQDPFDGGVYHKTTTANFEGFVPPNEATAQRYVVSKSTTATLDFSAVLARSAKLLKAKMPDYSISLLNKAELAWKWAVDHPDISFKNPQLTSPPISTGGYSDRRFEDEFFWAACELYLATGNEQYLKHISINNFREFKVPSWSAVETLGLISLSSAETDLPEMLKKQASDQLLHLAEELISTWREAPYKITLTDFRWGSNSEILNQGMVLINAYRLFGNSEFYEAALSALDYVLGRNATGYCFVTGNGTKSPMNIHHRPSASDDVEAPVPGFLVGGPNPQNIKSDCGQEKYVTLLPARCYLDDECSYSTNEVAINWNASLVYLTATLQYTYLEELRRKQLGL